MSVEAMEWALRQRVGSSGAKAVLLVLANRANQNGVCWPSVRTIADETEMGSRTVHRHLEQLRSVGVLSWSIGSGRGSNVYTLDLRSTAKLAEPETRSTATETCQRGRTSDVVLPDWQGVLPNTTRSTAKLADEPKEPSRTVEAEAARAKEIVPVRDLTPVAVGVTAIVTTWTQANPGHTAAYRRDLGCAVDKLLASKADPDLIQAALDEAHGNPKWVNPVAALPLAYAEVVRRRNAPTNGHARNGKPTLQDKAMGWLNLS